MPKNTYNNLLFAHIDGFEIFFNFLGTDFELSSPTSRGDNRRVPGTRQGSSHNRPWHGHGMLYAVVSVIILLKESICWEVE